MPYELYLIRHAIAAERGKAWPDDGLRPLTEGGRARFKEGVAGLSWLGIELDEVFTSPLTRARQTAEMLAAGLGGRPPVVKPLDALAPGHSPQAVLTELKAAVHRRRIALVGHEPELGELAAHLIGAGRALAFKKGSVCRIEVDSFSSHRPGALVWFMTPKVLRRLGRVGG